jgi:hypothetical protein
MKNISILDIYWHYPRIDRSVKDLLILECQLTVQYLSNVLDCQQPSLSSGLTLGFEPAKPSTEHNCKALDLSQLRVRYSVSIPYSILNVSRPQLIVPFIH